MAPRFQFRLETVRKLRAQARDQQHRVVADAMHQLSRIEERISLITKELRNSVEHTRLDRSSKNLDVLSLRENQLYRGWLHRKIMEADAELVQSKVALDLKRVKLQEASKQFKVIEKLRERRWDRFQTRQQREERMLNDEAALQLYERRQQLMDQEVRT